MKKGILILCLLVSFATQAQQSKKYFVYLNPLAFCFRNPMLGFEFKLNNSFPQAIQVECSYLIQDRQVGGFLQKGYASERSTLVEFESYPRNQFPFFVYNGPTWRVSFLKYLNTRSVNPYFAISMVGRLLHYDSLEVNYSNTPKYKWNGFYESGEFFSHTRMQNEKLRSLGLGAESGIRKSKENFVINLFVRLSVHYSYRTIKSYNEKYVHSQGSAVKEERNDSWLNTNSYSVLQFRPEIGLRIGLTNF